MRELLIYVVVRLYSLLHPNLLCGRRGLVYGLCILIQACEATLAGTIYARFQVD